MQTIAPHLWFDTEARSAAAFYAAVFGHGSEVLSVSTLDGTPSGSVDVVRFSIWGYAFDAISAGPLFRFTPAISISVQCRSEEEIDAIHGQLADGGRSLMPLDTYGFSAKFGWVEDRYGLSWQLNLPAGRGVVAQRIAPFLLFAGDRHGKAEEAMRFYVTVFPDSRMGGMVRHGGGSETEGTVQHAVFTLAGQQFMAMDSAGPHACTFNEAVSLLVRCRTQEEIDRYWSALSAVPDAEQCGWLKDRYGVSWQIAPASMDEMMASGDREAVGRVTRAFLRMKKFDIAALERAYRGESA